MTNVQSFTLTKQIFFAWKHFRKAFAYTHEFNRDWFSHNPYNLDRDAIEFTLNKAIANSPLSIRHQALARNLFFHNYTKQVLIESRDATVEDFNIIRTELRATIGYYTHCEQEKRYLEDFLDNRFDAPNRAPFLIRHHSMNYYTLRTLLDVQNVLTADEEALLSLFVLGEIPDYALTDAQRLIIIDAYEKIKEFFRRTDMDFYMQVAELCVSLLPHYSFTGMCQVLGINADYFKLIFLSYLKKRSNEERRRKRKELLDD